MTFGYLERAPPARADQGAPDRAVELRALRRPVQGRRPLLLHQERRPAEPDRALHAGLARRRAARAARPEHAVARTAPSPWPASPVSDDGKLPRLRRRRGRLRLERRGRCVDIGDRARPRPTTSEVDQVLRRRVDRRTARASSTAASPSRRRATSSRALNLNQKLYYHRLGTPQATTCWSTSGPDHPEWGFGGDVTDDGRYLVITVATGHRPARTASSYKDLAEPVRAGRCELIDDFDATVRVHRQRRPGLLLPDRPATPRAAASIAIDTRKPAREATGRRSSPRRTRRSRACQLVGNLFVASYLKDAQTRSEGVRPRRASSSATSSCPASAPRPASAASATDTETFYSFTQLHHAADHLPLRHDDRREQASSAQPKVKFDPAAVRGQAGLLHEQGRHARCRCSSTHKKGLKLDGTEPDAAVRLRRVQHLADARRSRVADLRVDGDGRRLRAWPTSAAAASTARPGTRPARSCEEAERVRRLHRRRPSG